MIVDRAERFSPLCGLIRESTDKCRIALPPSTVRRKLVDVPVYKPIEYSTILVDFRRRLEVMVSYAEQVGALPILILPPANDTGFEPNRSFLPRDTPPAEREAFGREFLAARRLEADDPSSSMNRYRDLLSHQPGFAERTIGWPSFLNAPPYGMRLTVITSPPAIWTAIRCAA